MSSRKFRSPAACILFQAMLVSTRAEEDKLGETLVKMTGVTAERYVAPLVSAIGSDLNVGWYFPTPPALKSKFTIRGGLAGMGTVLGSGERSFDVQGSFRFNREISDTLADRYVEGEPIFVALSASEKSRLKATLSGQLSATDQRVRSHGPTLTGSASDTVRIDYAGSKYATGLSAPYPDSVDIPPGSIPVPRVTGGLQDMMPLLPLAAFQLSVGTYYGTNVVLRWLPVFSTQIGKIKFTGLGIQHNPNVWMKKKLPVDLCLSLFTQKIEVGDLLEAQAGGLGLRAEKTFGGGVLNITPYGGFQFEQFTMNFHYDVDLDPASATDPLIPVRFELEGDDRGRIVLGANLRYHFASLNLDCNLAKYPSFSAGLMFGR